MQNPILSSCIHCALPQHLCVCDLQINLPLPLQCCIILHAREMEKASSTGRLLYKTGICRGELWHRTQHNGRHMFTHIDHPCYLLHPQGEITLPAALPERALFIALDGTWQQANKILRQDSFLADLPRVRLPPADPSQLCLRRNQLQGGLSTLESIASLLKYNAASIQAAQLMALFEKFQHHHLMARNQGYYNLCKPV
ncbi:MAG: DTW domain-containing protein [Oceanospirillaceae bacterium]|nr:DTW domain-containing protein [Oceanospirillaceae bacterium]MCP5334856.1 DTW domain-containing protein [Oceanospirillaceae bacterium]MCP5349527.1 DTW domain-containing protein [Oceanospirillaceae bacterium]